MLAGATPVSHLSQAEAALPEAVECTPAAMIPPDAAPRLELPARERRSLEHHLSRCEHCAEYLNQMKATIVAVGRVDPDQLSPATRQALMDLYRQTIQSRE